MGLLDRFGHYKKFKIAETHKNDGDAYFQEGKYREAVDCYRLAVEAMPDYHEAYYAMAEAYKELGQRDKVAECMNKAIALEGKSSAKRENKEKLTPGPVTRQRPARQEVRLPGECERLIKQGEAFEQKQEYEEAVKYYKQAAKEDPGCALAYLRQGQVYLKKKYISKAYLVTKKAQIMEPGNPEILYTLGVIRRYQHDYPKAVELIRRSLDMEPGRAIAYSELGIAYLKMDKLHEALESFRKAVELEPGNFEFQAMQAEVEKAVLAGISTGSVNFKPPGS